MESTANLMSAGDLFVAASIGVATLVSWLGLLSWKLSGTLSVLVKATADNGVAIKDMQQELKMMNTRLSQVEGHIGLLAGRSSS